MKNNFLNPIKIKKLKILKSDDGSILHALKKKEKSFKGFGEAYFSTVKFGKIKAWKKHEKHTMNLIVPYGKVKFLFYLEKKNKFFVYELGENNYSRLTVPPKIWFGFKGKSKKYSLILNVSNHIHDPNEVKRKKISEISFNWKKL